MCDAARRCYTSRMSRNKELAALFQDIAHMLELTGADRFRVVGNERAARAIAEQNRDVTDLADDPAALAAIDGIGKKTVGKIQEFAKTGTITEHEELLREVPRGLLALFRIPGLGPKTVRALWKEKGVEGMEDLERAIEDGSILDVPRMGAKTVENIKEAIAFAQSSSQRVNIGVALPIAEWIVEQLRGIAGVEAIEYAGSLRRGKETIGDIDILVAAKTPERVREAFTSLEGVVKVLAAGESKSSIRLQRGSAQIQADLRVVPKEAYGAALMYFTGSKEHNVRLRERAIKRQQTLNEYGLFPVDPESVTSSEPPQRRGVKAIASKTEADIYKALDLPFIAPELREDRGEVSDSFEAPDLIEWDDIVAELHAHTTASDGRMSIDELASEAMDRGYHTIAVTDHSQSSVIPNGLKPDRLERHIEAVHAVDARMKGITVLAGSEVDIHVDGRLDYEDELLAKLDVVVASPHASLRQEPGKAMQRLLRAIEHPLVHVIGHPTGRLIGKREGLHLDVAELAAAASEHRVALELNANFMRLDLRDTHLAIAIEHGALIAIDCDVHASTDFDHLRYAILTARRAGLTPDGCVNAWPARKLRAWLKSKRG